MNRKQIVVLWISGVLLALAIVLATYDVHYQKGGPSVLDELEKGWKIKKLYRSDIIVSQMVRYIPPILIIGGLLVYSLKNKDDESAKRISSDKRSS